MNTEANNEESLAALLTHYMNKADFGTTTLADAVTAKFGSDLISRSTLTNWRDGQVKSLRSKSWEALATVLNVLELDRDQANRVLKAAGLRSLEELWSIHSNDERVQRIFEPWLDGNKEKSKVILQDQETVLLSTLKPLAIEQRALIRDSREVLVVGINLFRFFPAFQLEFRQMLERGGIVRVVLCDPEGAAMKMAALRSESRTPEETQRQRTREALKLLSLWKSNSPKSDIEVRLLDYLLPFAITIMKPANESTLPRCLVRINAFRASTTTAMALDIEPKNNPRWFDFFTGQFEKMWEAAEGFSLLQ